MGQFLSVFDTGRRDGENLLLAFSSSLALSQCEGYGLIVLYTCPLISVSIARRQEGW